MINFSKLEGLGNDYLFIEDWDEEIKEPSRLAKSISDRHYGVGSDGIVLLLHSQKADLRMRMFNSDGSEAEMCGNGMRCFVKYAYDHHLKLKFNSHYKRMENQEETLQVETLAGLFIINNS